MPDTHEYIMIAHNKETGNTREFRMSKEEGRQRFTIAGHAAVFDIPLEEYRIGAMVLAEIPDDMECVRPVLGYEYDGAGKHVRIPLKIKATKPLVGVEFIDSLENGTCWKRVESPKWFIKTPGGLRWSDGFVWWNNGEIIDDEGVDWGARWRENGPLDPKWVREASAETLIPVEIK